MGFPNLQAQREFAAYSSFLNPASFITYDEIFEAYRESEFGLYHLNQPLRFAKYSYGRNEMLQDLGDDVHPVLHMHYTFRQIANPLVREQVKADNSLTDELSPEDIVAIRLAALLHDIGECEHPKLEKTCGDIHKFDRTPEHELIEQAAREFIYGEALSFVDTKVLERTEKIIMKIDPTDLAAKTFEVAEELGYFKTGIRAGEIVLVENLIESELLRARQLARLALEVPFCWVDKLENAAEVYPHIKNELSATRSLYFAIQKIAQR